MLFSEFIADLENCDSGLPVLLASRTNADESLADNCAQLRAFGAILVDGAGTDVDLRPTSGDVRLNVGEVLELCSELQHAMQYTVNGIDEEILLPDGRVVRSSTPLLGVLGLEDSVLLLLGTAEHWPSLQFKSTREAG